MSEQKYWAFISYSHQDEAWATWLHRALETYRVPPRLVGRATEAGAVPRRLFPVFRDRDELPSSHELGAVINRALDASRNLIVVCSPRSATSKWVNEEIKAFRALGRSHRVFCLIVDGEPHASADPEHAFAECFAPALRGDAGFEPIAADARPRKDGKDGAKLKLIAGLLGLGLDELKQREQQRQLWQNVQRATVAASLAVVALGAWRSFAQHEQARGLEARIEKLYDAGRRELLAHYESRAATYLAEALRLGRDTPALRFLLGQAMQPIDAQGDIVLQAGGPVRRPAFSPDNRRVVTPTQTAQGTVAHIWDTASGRRVAEFSGLPASPLIARFLDTEQVLVSGFETERLAESRGEGAFTGVWSTGGARRLRFEGHSGRFGQPTDRAARWVITADARDAAAARVWSLADGALHRTLDSGARVLAASLSPDGRWALTGDDGGAVQLWELAGGSMRRLSGRLPHHVVGTLFTGDGRRALAVGRMGDVRVWDVASGALELAFAVDRSGVADLALSHDGRTLVSAGSGGYKFWDLERGILLFARGRDLTQWSSMALSPDSTLAITTDNAQTSAEVLDLPARSLLLRLEQHGPISSAAFSADGNGLLTATEQGEVRLWRLPIRLARTLRHPREDGGVAPLLAARFDPRGQRVLTAGHDGTLRLWSWPDGGLLQTFEEGDKVQDAVFSPTGAHLASLTAAGMLRLRDARTLEPVRTLRRPPVWNPFGALHFSRDARWFTALPDAAEPGVTSLEVWSADGGAAARTLELGCKPSVATFTPDSTGLIVGCTDGRIQAWDLATAARRAEFAGFGTRLRALALAPDGGIAAFADEDRQVRQWATSGEALPGLTPPEDQAPYSLALAPDGELAVGLSTGAIMVRSADGGLRTLDAQAPVAALRYVSDGLLLSYRADDSSVKVWDSRRGELLSELSLNGAMVWTVEVSPDGDFLLAGGLDGRASIARIAPETRSAAELQALLRCRAPWTLSEDRLEAAGAPAATCAGERPR